MLLNPSAFRIATSTKTAMSPAITTSSHTSNMSSPALPGSPTASLLNSRIPLMRNIVVASPEHLLPHSEGPAAPLRPVSPLFAFDDAESIDSSVDESLDSYDDNIRRVVDDDDGASQDSFDNDMHLAGMFDNISESISRIHSMISLESPAMSLSRFGPPLFSPPPIGTANAANSDQDSPHLLQHSETASAQLKRSKTFPPNMTHSPYVTSPKADRMSAIDHVAPNPILIPHRAMDMSDISAVMSRSAPAALASSSPSSFSKQYDRYRTCSTDRHHLFHGQFVAQVHAQFTDDAHNRLRQFENSFNSSNCYSRDTDFKQVYHSKHQHANDPTGLHVSESLDLDMHIARPASTPPQIGAMSKQPHFRSQQHKQTARLDQAAITKNLQQSSEELQQLALPKVTNESASSTDHVTLTASNNNNDIPAHHETSLDNVDASRANTREKSESDLPTLTSTTPNTYLLQPKSAVDSVPASNASDMALVAVLPPTSSLIDLHVANTHTQATPLAASAIEPAHALDVKPASAPTGIRSILRRSSVPAPLLPLSIPEPPLSPPPLEAYRASPVPMTSSPVTTTPMSAIQARRAPASSRDIVRSASSPPSSIWRASPRTLSARSRSVKFSEAIENVCYFSKADPSAEVSKLETLEVIDTGDLDVGSVSSKFALSDHWIISEKNMPSHSHFGSLSVVLDHITIVAPSKLQVTIMARNHAFEKMVHVRYTTNTWKTHSDVQASFQSVVTPNMGDYKGVDRFSAIIDLDLEFGPSSTSGQIEFAIRFEVASSIHWDNNGTQNYRIKLSRPLQHMLELTNRQATVKSSLEWNDVFGARMHNMRRKSPIETASPSNAGYPQNNGNGYLNSFSGKHGMMSFLANNPSMDLFSDKNAKNSSTSAALSPGASRLASLSPSGSLNNAPCGFPASRLFSEPVTSIDLFGTSPSEPVYKRSVSLLKPQSPSFLQQQHSPPMHHQQLQSPTMMRQMSPTSPKGVSGYAYNIHDKFSPTSHVSSMAIEKPFSGTMFNYNPMTGQLDVPTSAVPGNVSAQQLFPSTTSTTNALSTVAATATAMHHESPHPSSPYAAAVAVGLHAFSSSPKQIVSATSGPSSPHASGMSSPSARLTQSNTSESQAMSSKLSCSPPCRA